MQRHNGEWRYCYRRWRLFLQREISRRRCVKSSVREVVGVSAVLAKMVTNALACQGEPGLETREGGGGSGVY